MEHLRNAAIVRSAELSAISKPSFADGVSQAAGELALANRILALQKIVDAFGHVSQRSPDNPEQFLLARNMAPGSVTARDILTFDADGAPVRPDGPPVYLERFIHAEIYRARPDVMSVVHSHSPAVLPLSVTRGVSLRCVCHMAGFIGTGAPVFEIRDVEGDGTDLLIRSNRTGAALAECLGGGAVVLMRGHGSTTVGASLRQAVFRAVYAEANARIQCEAMKLGAVEYLTAAEAAAASAASDTQLARPWALWAAEVQDDLLAEQGRQ